METEEYIIAMREYFHENPELSFKEFKTADRLEKELVYDTVAGTVKARVKIENGEPVSVSIVDVNLII